MNSVLFRACSFLMQLVVLPYLCSGKVWLLLPWQRRFYLNKEKGIKWQITCRFSFTGRLQCSLKFQQHLVTVLDSKVAGSITITGTKRLLHLTMDWNDWQLLLPSFFLFCMQFQVSGVNWDNLSLASFNFLLLKIVTETALLFLLSFAWFLYLKLLKLILDLFPSCFQNVVSRILLLNNISLVFRSSYQFGYFKLTVNWLL